MRAYSQNGSYDTIVGSRFLTKTSKKILSLQISYRTLNFQPFLKLTNVFDIKIESLSFQFFK